MVILLTKNLVWKSKTHKDGLRVEVASETTFESISSKVSNLEPIAVNLVDRLTTLLKEDVSLISVVNDGVGFTDELNVSFLYETFNFTMLVGEDIITLFDIDINPNHINHTVPNTGRDRAKVPTKTESRCIETKIIGALLDISRYYKVEHLLVQDVATEKVASILTRFGFEKISERAYIAKDKKTESSSLSKLGI